MLSVLAPFKVPKLKVAFLENTCEEKLSLKILLLNLTSYQTIFSTKLLIGFIKVEAFYILGQLSKNVFLVVCDPSVNEL